jgi:AbrB family looped-hinge helix DNA binding protein
MIGMELVIDKAGRVVVPKALRNRYGFKPGAALEVVEQSGGVLLRQIEERPSMTRIKGLWVHQGTPEPGANWDQVIDRVRDERIQSILGA